MTKTNLRKSTVRKSTGKKNSSIIVGVGASAGGLEAFSELLKKLPEDTGMSIVFIQHLEPKHESKLTEIFSRITTIPVRQITNNTTVTPNHIYIIPPDKYLEIRKGKLLLTERVKKSGKYLPIDYFFESLARDQKNKAIGIILSGTATDGTIGLAAIKSEGGLTFAQDQQSAKYPGMPQSAFESGNVDLVLPPGKIARELARIGKHPYITLTDAIKPSKKYEKEIQQESNDLNEIFKVLLAFSGIDFSSYKLSTILRRLHRRMVINKIQEMKEYEKLIKKDKDEVKKLYSDLLINVTSFFRDPGTYKSLASKIFPKLIKSVSPNHPLRVWVTGCSTGEEVYSIAISLREFLDKKSKGTNFQIFATDISDLSIEKARAGIYPEMSFKDVPVDILNKYFMKSNGMFQVAKFIRDRCIFARHDLINDPPYSKVDLISCRNLLIYLSPELQKKVIPRFHYSLNPGGILLLGTSESIGSLGNLFQIVDVKNKIYKRKELENRIDYNFYLSKNQSDKINYKNSPSTMDILKEADTLIMSKYTPAAILINQKLDILQFRGNIKEFLDPAPGNASLNLFKMIREGMNIELHTLIKRATSSKKPAYFENVKINKDGLSKTIDLEVVPLKTDRELAGRFFLIFFIDSSKTEGGKSSEKTKMKGKDIKEYSDAHFEDLKAELQLTKEHLQSIIEEREGANEELRSALEELQSSNEELQSTNEEMETAREELQSTNEELITTNDELENRNNELNEINNDLNNLLVSINTAIVLLGKDLKIRRYTQKAETIWNLIPGDIGRPISHMKPNFEIIDLEKLTLEVMDDLESKEIEIRDNRNTNYSMKIRPYKTMDGKIDGAVISLYDVDARTKAMQEMTSEKDYYESVLNTVNQPLLVLDNNLNIHHANECYYSTFNSSDKETIGKSVYLVNNQLWNLPLLKQLLEELIPRNKSVFNFEVNVSGNKKMLLNARILNLINPEEDFILLAITITP